MTTLIYDADGRVTHHVTASAWTDEDRALMLAWRIYSDSLCRGCSQPVAIAWHPDMNGWYEVDMVECQACSAVERKVHGDEGKPREYPMVVDTRDYSAKPLPPMPVRRRAN